MSPVNRPSRTLLRAGVLALVAAPLVLGACSGSAATGGEGLIERDLADSIGLGALDAECEEPASKDEGETYRCTATTEDGRVIEFLGTVESSDRINVVTTNLITLDDLEELRADAATSLNEANGFTIDKADIDCGDEPVILETDELICELTDVTDDSVWELIIMVESQANGELLPYYKIGDQLS